MNIVIIEDEANAREILRLLIEKLPEEYHVIGEASSVREGKLLLQGLKFDILLLDVEMMDGTGFQILEHFPNLEASVIFTTAFDNYAIRAMKNNAIDYLLKPISLEELKIALAKCKKREDKAATYRSLLEKMRNEIYGKRIPINSTNKVDFVSSRDIIYCQAEGSYSTFVLISGEQFTCSRPLKHYDELLAGEDFFRINKSQLVNLNAISQYQRNIGFGQLTMVNGDILKISRRKKVEFNAVVKEM